MKKGFEKVFSDIQTDMVSVCLEYVQKKADKIYIYASYEAKIVSCDYFYCINGNVYKRDELPSEYDADADRQMACLDILLDDMEDLISACEEYEADMPTEIKIIYDVKNNKLNANYQYENQYSNTENCADDIAEYWYQEICKN